MMLGLRGKPGTKIFGLRQDAGTSGELRREACCSLYFFWNSSLIKSYAAVFQITCRCNEDFLMQIGVFGGRFPQQRTVCVRVLPQRQEVLVRGASVRCVG